MHALKLSLEECGSRHALTLEAFKTMAEVHIHNRNFSTARGTLHEAVRIADGLRPDSVPVLLATLSRVHLHEENLEEALCTAQQACELLPTDNTYRPQDRKLIYEQLSLSLEHNGQIEQSRKYSARAAQLGTHL